MNVSLGVFLLLAPFEFLSSSPSCLDSSSSSSSGVNGSCVGVCPFFSPLFCPPAKFGIRLEKEENIVTVVRRYCFQPKSLSCWWGIAGLRVV